MIDEVKLGVVGNDVVATIAADRNETMQAFTIDELKDSLRDLAEEPSTSADSRFIALCAAEVLEALQAEYIACNAEPA